MRHRRPAVIGILGLALSVIACETQKSRNPLSPSVAGPLPGVTITAPLLLEPGTGSQVSEEAQPITLVIQNASTTGERPLSYLVEVGTDVDVTTQIYRRDDIVPGEDGRTEVSLPEPLETGRTYYWRARAQDGANTGPFSETVFFDVFTPVVIGAPVPLAPTGGVRVTSRRPTFAAQNAPRSGPADPLSYQFQIGTHESFSDLIAVVTIEEQADQTSFTLAQDLDYDRLHYWRVRAFEAAHMGPWSGTQAFYTPLAPPPPPPPPIPAPTPAPSPAPAPPPPPSPPPPPAPSPTPGGTYPDNGPAVVAHVEQTYPQYLVAGVSLSQREANMEFLRDRIIEVGICGGMDLAWNLKRGVGPHSIDAIAWRTGGRVEVVDIGTAFDDTSRPLRLQWAIVGGPPGYDPYPTPSCP